MTVTRKLFAILLACALLVCSCGCSVLTSLIPSGKQEPIADPTAYAQEFENNRLYCSLDKRLQQCYGTLYTALTDGFEESSTVTLSETEAEKTAIGIAVTLPHDLADMDESKTLYNAFFYDNPHFFYVSNVYGLEGYEQDGVAHYNKLVLTYTMDVETRKSAKERLDAAVDAILRGRPQTQDEFETELYLHDKLVSNCTYDIAAADAGFNSAPEAYSAYGALVEGKAVCEGYARGMQLLFKQCEISSTLVLGRSVKSGEQHMWNLVTINGKDYHLDATWNDSEDRERHNYFNVTTQQIELSHRITDGQLGIVNCSATTDNYYVRNGFYVDSYDRETIAKIIADRIIQGDDYVELFFAPDKFDSALLFLKSRRAAEEKIEPFLVNSGLSLWEYTLYGETEEHILCIRKKT